MQGTQLPTERLAPGVPINPVVRNGILLGAIQLRRRSNHHPQARDSLLITLLILLLTRQHVSSLGPGDCPSESALIPKPLGTKASRRSGGAAATVVKTVANRLWSLEGYKPPGAEHLGSPARSGVSYCPAAHSTLPVLPLLKRVSSSCRKSRLKPLVLGTHGALCSERLPGVGLIFLSSSPRNHADGILSTLSRNLLQFSFQV